LNEKNRKIAAVELESKLEQAKSKCEVKRPSISTSTSSVHLNLFQNIEFDGSIKQNNKSNPEYLVSVYNLILLCGYSDVL